MRSTNAGEKVARTLVNEFQSLLEQPSSQSDSTFTICFTCRHYPIIDFKGGAKICVEKENNEDIAIYVQARLTNDDPKTNQIRGTIIQRASGIFQWARIVIDRVEELLLEGEVLKTIKEDIDCIPQDLNELYRELLEGVSQKDKLRVLKFI